MPVGTGGSVWVSWTLLSARLIRIAGWPAFGVKQPVAVAGAHGALLILQHASQYIDQQVMVGYGVPVGTGGSVWESNPPCPLLAGNTGFEDLK